MQKNKKKLEDMTLEELYELAKEQHIPKKSELNKEQLIKAIKQQQGGSMENKQQRSSQHGHKNPSEAGQGGGKGDTPAPKNVNPKDHKKTPGNKT